MEVLYDFTTRSAHPHFELYFYDVSQSPVPAWRASVPSERVKTKTCWFHVHHRRGCPLPSQLCVFAHGDDELMGVITQQVQLVSTI